ncbi:progestin and adipoQ receptor family member 3 isoform X2 [Cylas formicarius]|nr:progestin and adipoQ receptor family member 3 isoform X2 [Cylas formicarius]
MTVTLVPAKHEVVQSSDGEERCDACETPKVHTYDHTESLLEDLALVASYDDEKRVEKDGGCEPHDYPKAKKLLHYEDAPNFMKHNSFIRKGYRGILNTDLCMESVFWWTNETINIWSHIFGLVLFVSLTIYDLIILKIDAPLSDKILVSVILICFQACMALSALYHTFCCRSETDCDYFLRYDLFGIALSLYAIYVSGIYYAFWCDQPLQNFYLLTVTAIFVVAMALQAPRFNVNVNVKMATFVAWAVYGVLPTFHWAVKMGGFENPVVSLLLPRVFGMYVISGTAFGIYLAKIPERWSAGTFDFVGHSHQWWHFFVVGALYYWHNTGMIYVDYRLNHACANSMRIP